MPNKNRANQRCASIAAAIGIVSLFPLFHPTIAGAHGYVGGRFFPPTIATDDPFATDELALPTLSYITNPGAPAVAQIDGSFEFDKEILPKFALGISDDFTWQKPNAQSSQWGWQNLELNAKYQLWQNDPHEAIISIGMDAEIGGTGAKNVGVNSFTTYTPTLYFGKGFGDLPDGMDFLKPVAITGTIGQTIPAQSADPNALQLGFAFEYSLPYLEQHVKDIGLPAPFRNMIPLVEFDLSNPENRGIAGQTTGTINPGILWETPDLQIGVEAVIPINGRTGDHIGATVQMQLFIDDLLPKIFGHPLF